MLKRRAWKPEISSAAGFLMALPFTAIVLVFVAYPFVTLVEIAFGEPNGFGNIDVYLENGANMRVLRTTFALGSIVTILAVGLGAIVAWSMRTTQSKFMKLMLLIAVSLPFWMSSVIKIYAWTVLLQTEGMVNKFLQLIGIIDEPLQLLYNEVAVVIGMVYQLLPWATIPLFAFFSYIDRDLLIAAQGLGASRLRALRSILLPLALPGLFATAIIVYVMSIGFYITPVILGGFTSSFSATLIQMNIFQFYDITSAAITALSLLIGGMLLIGVGLLLVGRERLRRTLG